MSTDQEKMQHNETLAQDQQENRDTQTAKQFRKVVDVLDIENAPSFNNFPADKVQAYRLTALACGPLCEKYDKMPKEGIDLRYYYCHRVEMVAATGGEIITPIRTVLIDKDDKAYGFVSDGLPKELDTLRQVFGDGPYTEPMRITVDKIGTRKGYSTYTISPAD